MELQNSAFLTLVLFVFSFFWLIKPIMKSASKIAQNLPPGPRKLPFIGNLHNLGGSLPHQALQQLAKIHGPLMHLKLGEISTVIVSSPEMVKEIMKTHDVTFAQRPQILASEIGSYNGASISFAPYGDYWRQMRKVCNQELLSSKRVQSFSHVREEEVWKLIESLRCSTGLPINVTEKIFSLTASVVSIAAFGSKSKDQDKFLSLVKESISLAGGFDPADLFPSIKFLRTLSKMRMKLEKIHQQKDVILENIVRKHKAKQFNCELQKEEEDLVDVLLKLQQSGTLNIPIKQNNIKAIAQDMFSAGSDTSSTTVIWAMTEMMKNPKVMEKAQAEIRQICKGNKVIHETDIEGLSYLKLVIKETLRLHPPLPLLLPRECREACKIEGFDIPVKSKVIVNAWAIGRDPKYWNNAESFIPKRFESSSINYNGNSFEYIPFGAGRRMCPGIALGSANIELPLAQLLYHFNWELPYGMKPEDLDMNEAFGATVGRKKDLYLIPSTFTPANIGEGSVE